MSLVEPHRPGEEPDAGQRPDQQHVPRDAQQMVEHQGQSDEKEMDNMVNPGVEDEQQKEMWRKGATQKIHGRRVKQADATLAGVYECVTVFA